MAVNSHEQDLRKTRGITLVEVVTVMAVLIIVAAIVFPVLVQARRSGYVATSIVHLKQVGSAIEVYSQENDGTHPYRHVDPFVESGHIRSLHLLKSQADDFKRGYGYEVSQCFDQSFRMQKETSYESAFVSKVFWDWLTQQDEEPAILVDRTHGDVTPNPGTDCDENAFYYTGRMLRLYRDTSVKVFQFSVAPLPGMPPTAGATFVRARLFTDEPLEFR